MNGVIVQRGRGKNICECNVRLEKQDLSATQLWEDYFKRSYLMPMFGGDLQRGPPVSGYSFGHGKTSSGVVLPVMQAKDSRWSEHLSKRMANNRHNANSEQQHRSQRSTNTFGSQAHLANGTAMSKSSSGEYTHSGSVSSRKAAQMKYLSASVHDEVVTNGRKLAPAQQQVGRETFGASDAIPHGANILNACMGMYPQTTQAMEAIYTPLPTQWPPQQACAKEPSPLDDKGIDFKFKPRPDFATEVTFTIEPKKKPMWQKMMRCGFRPMITCGAPPFVLPPDWQQFDRDQLLHWMGGNQVTQIRTPINEESETKSGSETSGEEVEETQEESSEEEEEEEDDQTEYFSQASPAASQSFWYDYQQPPKPRDTVGTFTFRRSQEHEPVAATSPKRESRKKHGSKPRKDAQKVGKKTELSDERAAQKRRSREPEKTKPETATSFPTKVTHDPNTAEPEKVLPVVAYPQERGKEQPKAPEEPQVKANEESKARKEPPAGNELIAAVQPPANKRLSRTIPSGKADSFDGKWR